MWRRGLAAAMLVGAAGCGLSVRVTRLSGGPREALPIDATQVELFVDSFPAREYVAAAYLEVRDQDASNVELVDALRAKAADLGCDGVIVKRGQPPPAVRATCIFWRR